MGGGKEEESGADDSSLCREKDNLLIIFITFEVNV
jgi:hypothetical protein